MVQCGAVLWYVAVCCSVLQQCVAAVCCSGVLQFAAMFCSVSHRCILLGCFVSTADKKQCVAVCCSVLQRVAVCCSVLQYVAVCVLQCAAVCSYVIQCGCSVLRCVPPMRSTDTLRQHSRYKAVCCSVLQSIAGGCNVLQCIAVCCGVSHRLVLLVCFGSTAGKSSQTSTHIQFNIRKNHNAVF